MSAQLWPASEVILCGIYSSSVFRYSRPLFGNVLLTAGIAAEIALILLIDYTAAGNTMFGTAPIGLGAWLVVLPFAVGMLLLERVPKAFAQWREGRRLEPPAGLSVPFTILATRSGWRMRRR